MRGWLAITLAGAAALTLAACDRETSKQEQAAASAPVETPKRKPGLWKQAMSVEGLPITQTAELCLDEASDKELAWWAQQGVRSGCGKNEVSQNPDGSWSFSSVCDLEGGMRTTTRGQATGDFQSSYNLRAESTTLGAPIPEMNGTRTVNIEATWQGACPAGLEPGEMRLPDGRQMNILAMGKDPS